MPVRGRARVQTNLKRLVDKIGAQHTQRALTEALIVIEGYAASMTPMDTGNLLQSMYREVTPTADGYRARIGYTAAYAAAVHNAPGTLKGQPRTSGTGVGNYWDPDAEPEFLRKAAERDGRADVERVIQRYMTL